MLIRDLMTKDVIAVAPDLSLASAAKLMFEKKFNGVPVVDEDKKLLGLITQQDLIIKTHAVHLPTLIDLLSKIKVYKKDSSPIKGDIEKMLSLKVADVMNRTPVILGETALINEAAELFSNHHAINPIPVVAHDGTLAGIISRYDVLKFFVGTSTGHASIKERESAYSSQADKFIKEFEGRFLFVSKQRTKEWFWLELAFAIIGFIIAWALILRVVIQ